MEASAAPLGGGSARAAALLGPAVSATGLLALGICLDALVLHDVGRPVQALAFVGAVIGLASVGRAAVRALQLLRADRVQRSRLRHAERLPGAPRVLVLADPQPAAFCSGLLRPRVVVTDGALHALSSGALAAVLAHEHHHARRRDGLRRGVAEVLAAGLVGLPGVGDAGERYADHLELVADQAAERELRGAGALAAAMLAFDARGHGVAPERVDRLLGHAVRVRVARGTLTWAGALLAVLVATAAACTLATGCVDIFLLREDDATASRFGLLPVLALAAGLLARGGVPRRWHRRLVPR